MKEQKERMNHDVSAAVRKDIPRVGLRQIITLIEQNAAISGARRHIRTRHSDAEHLRLHARQMR